MVLLVLPMAAMSQPGPSPKPTPYTFDIEIRSIQNIDDIRYVCYNVIFTKYDNIIDCIVIDDKDNDDQILYKIETDANRHYINWNVPKKSVSKENGGIECWKHIKKEGGWIYSC